LAVIPLVTTEEPFSGTATAATFAVDELTESIAEMEPVAAGVKATPTEQLAAAASVAPHVLAVNE
jgi:hypothetical protein